MNKERTVLGLGKNGKRLDGSQDTVVFWDDLKDIRDTTEFYEEITTPNWDIPTVYARLLTCEYVVGSGHSTKCGTVVSKAVFHRSLSRDLAEANAGAKHLT